VSESTLRWIESHLWLANCYFVHNSLRFAVLLPFFNASFPRPFFEALTDPRDKPSA
jgi:hypothetical protein